MKSTHAKSLTINYLRNWTPFNVGNIKEPPDLFRMSGGIFFQVDILYFLVFVSPYSCYLYIIE